MEVKFRRLMSEREPVLRLWSDHAGHVNYGFREVFVLYPHKSVYTRI